MCISWNNKRALILLMNGANMKILIRGCHRSWWLMCSAARGMAVTHEEGHRAVPQWWCWKGMVMAGYAGSCHAVAPHTLPLACPRRLSDAPQPATHRLLHFSPHPTYAAPLPRTPTPLTIPLILHTSYRLAICSADERGKR